ncbi:MAG: hypothetical protein O3C17_21340 [Planctomycetota bacterium]|nr:hypothetical protein [Planctomycetota bacterium]
MNPSNQLRFARTIRTAASEQFLIQNDEGVDVAVADIHFADTGSVSVTLTILGEAPHNKQDAQVLVEAIDRQLLPMASLDDKNLIFNVVAGKFIGVFEKDE